MAVMLAAILANGAFELVDKDGAPAGWSMPEKAYRIEGGSGVNGTRCLAFENTDDPSYYRFPGQPLALKGGRIYHVSVQVRTENLVGDESGATFCIEWRNGRTGRSGGVWPAGVKGTHDQWQKVGRTFMTPPQVEGATLFLYCRKGMLGKAWFDDVRVEEEDTEPFGAFSSNAYQDMAVDGPLTFTAVFNATSSSLGAGLTARLEYTDSEGRPAAKAATVGIQAVTAKLDAAALAKGRSTVRMRLFDAAGREMDMAELAFTRPDALPRRRVELDRFGRTLIDGKPFFPLGMYSRKPTLQPHLDEFSRSPFNCLMPYSIPMREDLDLCHSKGILVMACLKDLHFGSAHASRLLESRDDEEPLVRKIVNEFKDHPALLAWYVNDEMSEDWIPRLDARRRLVRELDPGHPTWGVIYQVESSHRYLNTCDILGTDPYPVGTGQDLDMPLRYSRITVANVFGSRAVWQVPQAFDWGTYNKTLKNPRFPTREEMRSMSWQCIAAGANGIVFYSFASMHKMRPDDKTSTFEGRWADLTAVAEEIRREFPTLLSDPGPKVREAPDGMGARSWRLADGSVRMMFVNATERPVSGRVAFEDGTCREVSLPAMGVSWAQDSAR